MASKRDLEAASASDQEGFSAQPSSKRQRSQPSANNRTKTQQPATDITYGQRCVFPGLDDSFAHSDDDIDYEDEQDALSYLKSVRDQASGIPHLLVAPKAGPQLPSHASGLNYNGSSSTIDRSIYENGRGDSRGYYYDGAYTAAPDPEDDSEDDNDYEAGELAEDSDSAPSDSPARIQKAYFASLVAQFTSLRSALHQDPPPEALATLPRTHGFEVGRFGSGSKTFKIWEIRLRHTDPLPAQVAAMDKASALKVLRIILGGKFLRRGCELRERTSRWIWALLARLPDSGEMDFMEVGYVRELGKRAVLLLATLEEMAALRREVELEEGEQGDVDEEEEEEEVYVDEEDGGAEDDSEETHGSISHPALANGRLLDSGAANPAEIEDTDMEDGEVPEECEVSAADLEADIAAAKARLLGNIEHIDSVDVEVEPSSKGEAEEEAFDETRARINMRATLNMILTVAGEFYGQRDLLEFRAPFHGL